MARSTTSKKQDQRQDLPAGSSTWKLLSGIPNRKPGLRVEGAPVWGLFMLDRSQNIGRQQRDTVAAMPLPTNRSFQAAPPQLPWTAWGLGELFATAGPSDSRPTAGGKPVANTPKSRR
jgi:hypothetical protein